MNIQKHYNLLIQKRQTNLVEGITEIHHIVPRCMGGTDSKDNLVKLTPREHFIAHWMLTKIYPDNNKLKYALFCMVRDPHGHRVFTSKYYDKAKKVLAEQKRLDFIENNPMYTKSARDKMSKLKQGILNPNYGCGENNNNACAVTVVFYDGCVQQYSHGKDAYTHLNMSRSTWITGVSKGFHKRWNILKVIKNEG